MIDIFELKRMVREKIVSGLRDAETQRAASATPRVAAQVALQTQTG